MAELQTLTSSADIIEIANIDLACELEDPEVHPNGPGSFVVYYGRKVDSSGQPGNNAPIVIEAGKTRMFPRYMADHYARHLADHILTARKLNTNHKAERPKILAEIYRGMKESFSGLIQPKNEVTQVNEPIPVEETTPVKELVEPEVKVVDEIKPVPTKKSLFNELKVLGVKTTGKENVDTLISMVEKGAYGDSS